MTYCDVDETEPAPRRVTKHIVAVYLVDRAYGGPEEGDWWFDCGELVRVIQAFRNEQRAIRYCRRLNHLLGLTLNKGRRDIGSVLSEGRYDAQICDDNAPRFYPERKPHYE